MNTTKKKEKFTKTTAMLPVALLKEAQSVTGTGITQTLRIALELLANKKNFEQLLSLKGTYDFSLELDKLRE